MMEHIIMFFFDIDLSFPGHYIVSSLTKHHIFSKSIDYTYIILVTVIYTLYRV